MVMEMSCQEFLWSLKVVHGDCICLKTGKRRESAVSGIFRPRIETRYLSSTSPQHFGASSAETCFMFRTPNLCHAPPSLGPRLALDNSSPSRLSETGCGDFLIHSCYVWLNTKRCWKETRQAMQWRTQEFCSGGGSTNSVEDRGQRERDLGAVAP